MKAKKALKVFKYYIKQLELQLTFHVKPHSALQGAVNRLMAQYGRR